MRGFQPARGAKTPVPMKKTTAVARGARAYANGGVVRGPGTGTSDDVEEEVPNGSYIMPADSTEAVGEPTLSALGRPGVDPRDPSDPGEAQEPNDATDPGEMQEGEGVPVALSAGEFKMPPEQVYAIGVQALDQIKNATHTPVAPAGFVPMSSVIAEEAGEGEEGQPRYFFANGGVVLDEQTRRSMAPGRVNLPPASAGTYAPAGRSPGAPTPTAAPAIPLSVATGGAVTDIPTDVPSFEYAGNAPAALGLNRPIPTAPAAPQAPAQAPSPDRSYAPGRVNAPPAAAAGFAPAGRNVAPAGASQTSRVAAPSSAPAAAPKSLEDTAGWRTKAVMDGAAEDAQRAWDQGNYGQAAGAVTRGAITAIPTAFVDTAEPLVRGLSGFWSGVTGGASPAAAPAATSAAPAPKPPQAAQAMATAPRAAGNGQPSVPEQAGTAAPAGPNLTAAAQVRGLPGVYRVGNSYGDSAQAAIDGTVPGRLPTSQSQAAAAGLAERSSGAPAAPLQTSQPAGPVGFSAPGGAVGIGGDWRRQKDLENAATAASSILNTRKWGGPGAQNNPAVQAYQAALSQEGARQRGEMSAQETAMREAGATGRAGMEQQTALQREQIQQSGANARAAGQLGIERGRLALDQQVRGFDIRAAQNLEALQQQYLAAKTPEERASIAAQIRVLNGKADQANRFTVVPGGQEWDATAGVMRNVPARVLNNQTGQFVDGASGQTTTQPNTVPKIGETRGRYRYKGGNPNDQANWEKV